MTWLASQSGIVIQNAEELAIRLCQARHWDTALVTILRNPAPLGIAVTVGTGLACSELEQELRTAGAHEKNISTLVALLSKPVAS